MHEQLLWLQASNYIEMPGLRFGEACLNVAHRIVCLAKPDDCACYFGCPVMILYLTGKDQLKHG